MFYYFGLENALRHLFADPEWRKVRAKDRASAGFYTSKYAEKLDAATDNQFSLPGNSAYEIGFDNGQLFNFSQHSTGLMTIRC